MGAGITLRAGLDDPGDLALAGQGFCNTPSLDENPQRNPSAFPTNWRGGHEPPAFALIMVDYSRGEIIHSLGGLDTVNPQDSQYKHLLVREAGIGTV